MSKGIMRIYYGEGYGKSMAAVGTAIREIAQGRCATMISFLRKKSEDREELYKRFEPELKFFRFEKSAECFDALSEKEKEEEAMNLRNGFNYSKKVVSTGGSDLVVLDEMLDLVENGIISEEALLELIRLIPDDMVVICTGKVLRESVRNMADEVYQITLEK